MAAGNFLNGLAQALLGDSGLEGRGEETLVMAGEHMDGDVGPGRESRGRLEGGFGRRSARPESPVL